MAALQIEQGAEMWSQIEITIDKQGLSSFKTRKKYEYHQIQIQILEVIKSKRLEI